MEAEKAARASQLDCYAAAAAAAAAVANGNSDDNDDDADTCDAVCLQASNTATSTVSHVTTFSLTTNYYYYTHSPAQRPPFQDYPGEPVPGR